MYKKLLSFRRSSTDKTHMLHAEPEPSCRTTTGVERRVVLPAEPSCCATCCRCCSDTPAQCCPEDCSTCCQLCTAALVLPSCVGAIRALQCNFLRQAAAAAGGEPHRQQQMAKHSCCQAGSSWIPASESLTRHKLQIVANTRCCC